MPRTRYWITPDGRKLTSDELTGLANSLLHQCPITEWISTLHKAGKMSREEALEAVILMIHEAFIETREQLELAELRRWDLPDGPFVVASEECH